MESRTVTLSSSHNTAWECDDSRHGRDAASLKRRRTTTESPISFSSPSSDLAGNNYDVEALSTLRKKEGTPNVQGLALTFDSGSDDCFTSDEYGPLLNLRFLKLDRASMRGNFTSLLLKLRWLDWRGCRKSSEPLVLNLENLVILDLSWSAVADDWEGWTQVMEKANKLKVMELTGCGQLCKTPCFPPGSKLERLILERCSHLSFIDKSIGNLKYLKSFNIKSTPIALLPEEMGSLDNLEELLIDETSICHLRFLRGSMQQLKTLSASGCKNLAEISESIGCLRSLSYLALDRAIITGLPNSVQLLGALVELSLRDCQRITALPDSIGMLSINQLDLPQLPSSLSKLLIKNCKSQRVDFSNLETLSELELCDCDASKILGLGNLRLLQVLKISGCKINNLDGLEQASLLRRINPVRGTIRVAVRGTVIVHTNINVVVDACCDLNSKLKGCSLIPIERGWRLFLSTRINIS
ncbi:hypothetical protein NL676_008059 [Syzygium grande]|nr:hypothetical protein NL676_008059 [Syzygium grande]